MWLSTHIDLLVWLKLILGNQGIIFEAKNSYLTWKDELVFYLLI